jgi:transformer-2 protein
MVFSRSGDGSLNPGNNLHVSSLSHRVDTRDLEAAFAKIGRVRCLSLFRNATLSSNDIG